MRLFEGQWLFVWVELLGWLFPADIKCLKMDLDQISPLATVPDTTAYLINSMWIQFHLCVHTPQLTCMNTGLNQNHNHHHQSSYIYLPSCSKDKSPDLWNFSQNVLPRPALSTFPLESAQKNAGQHDTNQQRLSHNYGCFYLVLCFIEQFHFLPSGKNDEIKKHPRKKKKEKKTFFFGKPWCKWTDPDLAKRPRIHNTRGF